MAAAGALHVWNQDREAWLVERGRIAAGPWQRLVGLLDRSSLAAGDGLLLRGEQAIHTIGMRFAIDVAYLDRDGRILRILPSMPPTRLGPFVRAAYQVLEVPSGTFLQTGTQIGDRLDIQIR